MRLLISLTFFMLLFSQNANHSHADADVWIVEVDENPEVVVENIERDYPFVEILYTYDTLLQAVAVKGAERYIEELHQEEWVQHYSKATTYTAPQIQNTTSPTQMPDYHDNQHPYTGKGVKIGVIDTGIDYNHPDLTENYKGGFDAVDFDGDPMETTADEGMPTNHGTHVAGIIAANGNLRGVAPDAEIYAYRALGPGGSGTSAQVLAALEQAVKDGMDIINLSLGTDVNSPDYPMAQAVNKAFELGAVIVAANGNSGPEDWTVASPATAKNAISVGAAYTEIELPFIQVFDEESIPIRPIPYSEPWNFTQKHPIEHIETLEQLPSSIHDRIVIIEKKHYQYGEIVSEISQKGASAVIIYGKEEDDPNTWDWILSPLPVAYITKEEAEKLLTNETWLDTVYLKDENNIASFSARGPVTADWTIKPDLIAPGVDIVSTVPDGYAAFQGTSMAAPYVAGVLALLKEQEPYASPQTLKEKLLTATTPFEQDPSSQGSGFIQMDNLPDQQYRIENEAINLGKVTNSTKNHKHTLTIHNESEEPLNVTWNMPRRQSGLNWNIPLTTTVEGLSQVNFEIAINFQQKLLKKGVHEGYISLELNGEDKYLPYLFIHDTADYPRITGLEIEAPPFDEEELQMKLYIAEEIKALTIELFDQDLVSQGVVLESESISQGTFEKSLNKKDLESGIYEAVIEVVDDQNNTLYQSKQIMIP
ncbi:minor extracellular serine protease Vpr [Alkalibacillus filiformis]|uniref:Minor extracellular serine protease Vpr n=1 Tax=Alkalibacillus filiformis TaxID=200990 RepID=A0ABU0DW80_9BACI|nr:S8 family serine peptidase [Alkalibacillus filiformis]MDQ0352717.1 minor extracellular serine protease Vpr [Alkalibacillus filiformis]